MYKLFIDKTNEFECDIKLEGASLSNAIARLIVESEDLNLVFNGKISVLGKCTIPIKKLNHILNENTQGNMKLEVIADDTYFTPWKSSYVVERSKKLTVEVKEPVVSKPKIVVKNVSQQGDTKVPMPINESVKELSLNLIKSGITVNNIVKNSNKFKGIVKEYFDNNSTQNDKNVLRKVLLILAKRK